MQYRSLAELNNDIKCWAGKLPDDIEIIVGVPRSGLLAANLLSLYRHLPITDVQGLKQGRVIKAGTRYQTSTQNFFDRPRTVLVLDDSLSTGKQMAAVKEDIESCNLPHKIYYAAVYVELNAEKVDFFCKRVSFPRLFEWNMFHHSILENSCVDIDGVLCHDPSKDQNDDGELYHDFLQNAEQFLTITGRIGWLVTCRLEKYRAVTEKWLAEHGVTYDQLIMLDLPDMQTRKKLRPHAAFKAKVYKETGASLFVESSQSQAESIARLSGKPVLCVETGGLIQPKVSSSLIHYYLPKTIHDPAKAIRVASRVFAMKYRLFKDTLRSLKHKV